MQFILPAAWHRGLRSAAESNFFCNHSTSSFRFQGAPLSHSKIDVQFVGCRHSGVNELPSSTDAHPGKNLWGSLLLLNLHGYKVTSATNRSCGLPRNDRFKGRNTVHLLEASYFNIMPRWQLSTFNHQTPDFFAMTLEFPTIGEKTVSFPSMPDSCIFARNVCKLFQLFLIKCKLLSTEALFSLSHHPQWREAGALALGQGVCGFVTVLTVITYQAEGCFRLCHLYHDHFLFNSVCNQCLSEELCIWLSVPQVGWHNLAGSQSWAQTQLQVLRPLKWTLAQGSLR